jgi:hypothetical protein
VGSNPEPPNRNTNVPGQYAEPPNRTPRSRQQSAEPLIEASRRPLSHRLRAACKSKPDVDHVSREMPVQARTPSTRPRPEWDQMLMSPIRKAGGQQSPSHTREGERTTEEPAPRSTWANKRPRVSGATRTLDDGREFNNLPLLTERGETNRTANPKMTSRNLEEAPQSPGHKKLWRPETDDGQLREIPPTKEH